ncbi:hypothetical protein BLNAU_22511 [Blattamonas nauphoetae]|uniref:Uncharacterized protein n=1 Tax=Blattamonas nauphoetae TaxID=2049346 RepID=A0ABQ9WSU6_9EUKA|nr:hypothetical protein BLNAU_22511 [Blattamonas nauphoetae]
MFQWPKDHDNNKSNLYIRTEVVITRAEAECLELDVNRILQEKADDAVKSLLSEAQIEGKKTEVRVQLKPTSCLGYDGYCVLYGPALNGDLMNKLLDELVRMNHSGSHISHDRPQNTAELHFTIHGQQHSPSSTTKNVKVKISKPNALIQQSQDSQSTLRIPAGSSYGLVLQTESDIDESDVAELTQTITSHLTQSMTSIIQATPLFSHLQGFVPGLDLNFHQRTTFVFHGHAFFDGLDLGDQMLVADKVIELSRNKRHDTSRADQHKMGENVKLTFKCPERIVPLCIRLDPPSFYGPGLFPHNAPILKISSSDPVSENEIDCLHKFLSDLISRSIVSIMQQSGVKSGGRNSQSMFDLSLQSDDGVLSGQCTLKNIVQNHHLLNLHNVMSLLRSSLSPQPFPNPPDTPGTSVEVKFIRKERTIPFSIRVNRKSKNEKQRQGTPNYSAHPQRKPSKERQKRRALHAQKSASQTEVRTTPTLNPSAPTFVSRGVNFRQAMDSTHHSQRTTAQSPHIPFFPLPTHDPLDGTRTVSQSPPQLIFGQVEHRSPPVYQPPQKSHPQPEQASGFRPIHYSVPPTFPLNGFHRIPLATETEMVGETSKKGVEQQKEDKGSLTSEEFTPSTSTTSKSRSSTDSSSTPLSDRPRREDSQPHTDPLDRSSLRIMSPHPIPQKHVPSSTQPRDRHSPDPHDKFGDSDSFCFTPMSSSFLPDDFSESDLGGSDNHHDDNFSFSSSFSGRAISLTTLDPPTGPTLELPSEGGSRVDSPDGWGDRQPFQDQPLDYDSDSDAE